MSVEKAENIAEGIVLNNSELGIDEIKNSATTELAVELNMSEEKAREIVDQVKFYYAGWNIPGFMPDNPPSLFASLDQAKRYIIHELKFLEGQAETEEEAENFCHSAECANLWSTPESAKVGDYVYWINEN